MSWDGGPYYIPPVPPCSPHEGHRIAGMEEVVRRLAGPAQRHRLEGWLCLDRLQIPHLIHLHPFLKYNI